MNKYIKDGLKIVGCITALAAVAGGIAFIGERIDELKNYGKELRHKPYGVYERFIKRPLDCFLSTGALIVFSPILAVTALLVKMKLGSPILFKQERPGRNERIFRLYKFRTMTDERDEKGNLLSDDIRCTPFGKGLRNTSLDELPELINIVKGDMAVVGPRPLLVDYLPYYTKNERHRHDVRPGLTGLAQINGRNTITWNEKFTHDVDYVNNISFKQDIGIIVKTVLKVVKKSDIRVGSEFKAGKFLDERKEWIVTPDGAIPNLFSEVTE